MPGGELGKLASLLCRQFATSREETADIDLLGAGLVANNMLSGLSLKNNTFRRNQGDEQILLHGANATLTGNSYLLPIGGVSLLQDHCTAGVVNPDISTDGALVSHVFCPEYDELNLDVTITLTHVDVVPFQ